MAMQSYQSWHSTPPANGAFAFVGALSHHLHRGFPGMAAEVVVRTFFLGGFKGYACLRWECGPFFFSAVSISPLIHPFPIPSSLALPLIFLYFQRYPTLRVLGEKKKDGSHKFKGGGDVFQELHFPIFILVHLFPNKSS